MYGEEKTQSHWAQLGTEQQPSLVDIRITAAQIKRAATWHALRQKHEKETASIQNFIFRMNKSCTEFQQSFSHKNTAK